MSIVQVPLCAPDCSIYEKSPNIITATSSSSSSWHWWNKFRLLANQAPNAHFNAPLTPARAHILSQNKHTHTYRHNYNLIEKIVIDTLKMSCGECRTRSCSFAWSSRRRRYPVTSRSSAGSENQSRKHDSNVSCFVLSLYSNSYYV